jgi:dihydroorotase
MGELAEAGCVAVTQGEWPVSSAKLMRRVLEYAGCFDLPVISSAIERSLAGLCNEGRWSTRLGLPGSPAAAEAIAIARDLALAELTGQRLHLSRVSTRAGLTLIERAKDQGVNVTCDVTGHHLALTTAALVDYDANTLVWPPLRDDEDVAGLRAALSTGLIDAVVSDHQPHHDEDKAREFPVAASGVSALETVVPILMDRVAAGDLSALDMIRLLSAGPHAALGLEVSGLVEGQIADVSVLDPTRAWTVTRVGLASRGKNTPFLGTHFAGRATLTVVAGEVVYRVAEPEEGP